MADPRIREQGLVAGRAVPPEQAERPPALDGQVQLCLRAAVQLTALAREQPASAGHLLAGELQGTMGPQRRRELALKEPPVPDLGFTK